MTHRDLLYQELKRILVEKIFTGVYEHGDMLPAERELARAYSMSRITVRKTLQLMEQERLISREQGRGTICTARQGGYPGLMDIIGLAAPTNNPFFSSFIRSFEAVAEAQDSLVVFKQLGSSAQGTFASGLFRLYKKNIRDLVIWPYDAAVDPVIIRRLRSLGTNIVLFDESGRTPYADCVSVDNAYAIGALCSFVKSCRPGVTGFIGWEDYCGSSALERESAFCSRKGPDDKVFHIPWKADIAVDRDIDELLRTMSQGGILPPALVCADGNIGMAAKRALVKLEKPDIVVCAVDDFPGSEELGLTVYAQPMERLAEKTFEALRMQNERPDSWRASTFKVRGKLIARQCT